MSKKQSSETLIKITHGQDIETLELKDKIELLTDMLEKPRKMNRKTYQAKNFYNKDGQLNSDSLEYQLVGAATLTSIPVTLVFGSAIVGSLIKVGNVPESFVLASGTFIALEGILAATECARMTKNGSKMATEIRNKIAVDLEKKGYQVNLPEEPPKINFDTLIISLVNNISINQYSNYELDYERVRQLYSRWLNIKSEALANKGQKPQVPQEILSEYHSLYKEIHQKIKLFRYQNNNEKLLSGELVGGLNNNYISLIEEDEFIVKVRNLIDEILTSEYAGFADDIEELQALATDWLAVNIKNYRDKGTRLDSSFAPIHSYTEIEQRVKNNKQVYHKKMSK